MKKLFTLLAFAMLVSLNSCTDNIITEDDQLFFETQAIDKQDSSNPGGSGQGGEEGENDES